MIAFILGCLFAGVTVCLATRAQLDCVEDAAADLQDDNDDMKDAIDDLFFFINPNQPKDTPMTPLDQIAEIKFAVVALKSAPPAPAPVPVPATNFVTPDVQSALDDLAATVGVEQSAPAPAATVPAATDGAEQTTPAPVATVPAATAPSAS